MPMESALGLDRFLRNFEFESECLFWRALSSNAAAPLARQLPPLRLSRAIFRSSFPRAHEARAIHMVFPEACEPTLIRSTIALRSCDCCRRSLTRNFAATSITGRHDHPICHRLNYLLRVTEKQLIPNSRRDLSPCLNPWKYQTGTSSNYSVT